MRVHMPPSCAAKASGMSSVEAGCPVFCAHASTTGIIIATTGVLFMNALSTTTGT